MKRYSLAFVHDNIEVQESLDDKGLSLITQHEILKGDVIDLQHLNDVVDVFATGWFEVVQKVFLTENIGRKDLGDENIHLCCLLLKPTKIEYF